MSRGYLYIGNKQILTHGISGELSKIVEVNLPTVVPVQGDITLSAPTGFLPNEKVIIKDNLDGTYVFTTQAEMPSNNIYSGIVIKSLSTSKYQVAIIDKGVKNTINYTAQTIPAGLNVWIYYLDMYTGEWLENSGNVCQVPAFSIIRVKVQRSNGAMSIYHKGVSNIDKTDIFDTTTS